MTHREGISVDTRPQPKEFDEIFTPPSATKMILPYINIDWIVWECCYGEGHMAKTLKECGYTVVGGKGENCLAEQVHKPYDIIITNPPYAKHLRNKIIEMCIQSCDKFALLIRLSHLGGVGIFDLLEHANVQVIVPSRRVNFIVPKGDSKNMFHNVWLTRGLGLSKDLLFINYDNREAENSV